MTESVEVLKLNKFGRYEAQKEGPRVGAVSSRRVIPDDGRELAAKLSRSWEALGRGFDFFTGKPSQALFCLPLKLFTLASLNGISPSLEFSDTHL